MFDEDQHNDLENRISIFIAHMERLDFEISKLPDNPQLDKLFKHNEVAQEHFKTILYDMMSCIEDDYPGIQDDFNFLD